MLAFATLRGIVAPVLTLAPWLALRDTIIPRLREGRPEGTRRRVSQAARALLGQYPLPIPQPCEVS